MKAPPAPPPPPPLPSLPTGPASPRGSGPSVAREPMVLSATGSLKELAHEELPSPSPRESSRHTTESVGDLPERGVERSSIASEMEHEEGGVHGSTTAATATTTAAGAGAEKARSHRSTPDKDEAFHDLAADTSMPLVTKSIFKDRKNGFLARFKDASTVAASKMKLYGPGDSVLPATPLPEEELEGPPVTIVTTNSKSSSESASAMPMGPLTSTAALRRSGMELNGDDDDESIGVAIEQTGSRAIACPPPQRSQPTHFTNHHRSRDNDHDEDEDDEDDDDSAPQVIIHSAESDSDSGFAMLNPVLSRAHRGGGRRQMTMPSMAMPTTPALVEIPILEDPSTLSLSMASSSSLLSDDRGAEHERTVLVINALGATGLAKAEKFGTQSTMLELRLCDALVEDDPNQTQLPSGASHCAFLRTTVHKKGGSEAQWHQQFTTALRSNEHQVLHAAVRTSTKILVGETRISLREVGRACYDQHYTIYRPSGDHGDSCSGSRSDPAGQIHLQLKIVSLAEIQQHTTAIAPTPMPTARPGPREIPAALRNGALMFKVPYHSHTLLGPSLATRQWVAVCEEPGPGGGGLVITWCDPVDPSDKSRSLDLALVTEIREGPRTRAFERLLQNDESSAAREADRCLSLITRTRTLDLIAASKDEARVWRQGLQRLIFGHNGEQGMATEDRATQRYRQSALATPRDAKSQLAHWQSAIFADARRNDLAAISACLHDGCPVDLLEAGSGDTLLMLACRAGNVELVDLCLLWRAKNDPHPEFGETALQVAVNNGHPECVALILSTAAKSDMDAEIVNHIDSNNDAPLHVAARRGDLACLELLLHHGADICVVEEFGRTPLHCAVLSGAVDCVAYLLDVGGDSVLNAGDHDGDTALHYAAMAGNRAIVRLLLESAADVHSVNVHDETPHALAQREGHDDCVTLIGEYFIVPAQEPTPSTPATRNETASTLLLLQQQQQQQLQLQTQQHADADEQEEEYEVIDESPSPVRRGPIPVEERHAGPHWGPPPTTIAYGHPTMPVQPPAAPTTGSFYPHHHPSPISPSARVREVLASHREQRVHYAAAPHLVHHYDDRGAILSSSACAYSARDDLQSRYDPSSAHYAPVPVRQAFTERIDRDPPRRGFAYDEDPRYPRRYHPQDPYDAPYDEHDRRRYAADPPYGDPAYPPAGLRGRSHSATGPFASYYDPRSHVVGDQRYRDGREDPLYSPSYAHPRHRSNSADTQFHQLRNSAAWHGGVGPTATPYADYGALPPVPAPAVDEWETFYSPEGYPYYLNRRTGESQWEHPYSSATAAATNADSTPAAVGPLPPAAPSPVPLGADAQVRLRLAEVRQSKVTTIVQGPTPTNAEASLPLPPPESSLRGPESTEKESTISPPPSPCAGTFKSRMGRALSVDVTSPPRVDETRPVFVPSPRANSPSKTKKASSMDALDGDPSFQKSTRPSSPRGKSKNVQLLDVKRANNLALALSSFKISDRYEQTTQAIAALDDTVINAELLICLQRLFPSDDEIALLREYEGPLTSLGKADRFFYYLVRISDIQQRIECFLYKLEFARAHRNVRSKIQLVRRACRDLVENFAFVEVLDKVFESASARRSFRGFKDKIPELRSGQLGNLDEKLVSFREDLRRAADVELLDVQMQFNRLITGMRPIQAFVDRKPPTAEEHEITAHDVLQRFIAETRTSVAELESDYEGLGQWEDKVLAMFGESRASCRLTPILESICELLER